MSIRALRFETFQKLLPRLVYDDGAVLDGHDALLLEGVEDALVLGPRHELDGRVRLDVATDHSLGKWRQLVSQIIKKNHETISFPNEKKKRLEK